MGRVNFMELEGERCWRWNIYDQLEIRYHQSFAENLKAHP
jgi:hypothetical protein